MNFIKYLLFFTESDKTNSRLDANGRNSDDIINIEWSQLHMDYNNRNLVADDKEQSVNQLRQRRMEKK